MSHSTAPIHATLEDPPDPQRVVSPPPDDMTLDPDVQALAAGARIWELAALAMNYRDALATTALIDLYRVGEWPRTELLKTLLATVQAAREVLGVERETEPGAPVNVENVTTVRRST